MPAEQAWLTELESPAAAQGAMDADRFYLPLESVVIAFNRRTGEAVWRSEISTEWPPILAGGSLLVATTDGIQDLDSATGARKRVLVVPSPPAGPMTLAGDLLLAPSLDDSVYALRLSDGGLAWRQSLGAGARRRAAIGPSGTAFFTLADARVAAVSLTDGRVRWTAPLAGTLTEPVASRDRVFVGSTENAVYALDAANGRLKWTWPTGGDVVGLATDDASVYVVSLDNVIRALNRASGHLRWKQPLGTRPTFPPRLVDGLLIVAGVQPALGAFAATTGRPVSTYALEGSVEDEVLGSAPLVATGDEPSQATAVLVMRSGSVVGLRGKRASDAAVSEQ